MRWQQPEYLDNDAVKIPSNWLYISYYEALTVLFRIENALRTFVYVVLKEKNKSTWASLSIKTDEGPETNIAAIAKKRLAQDKAFGYLGYAISSPLMHLTSGELIRLILHESYWPMFAEYFPAQKNIVETKLEEIGNVRNALAHFRPVTNDDVQVVKQNANQVLSGVERLLGQIVMCHDIVPTNSTDAWYGQLKMLTGPYVAIRFNQTSDEKWVRLGLEYKSPIIARPYMFDTLASYRVLTINTPRLLKQSKRILENLIFASDQIPHVTMPDEGPPTFSKTVRLLFGTKSLAEDHDALRTELEEVVQRITTETDLIKEDNLARGEIVQTTWVSARRETDAARWHFDTRGLKSRSTEGDPPEYWAGYPIIGGDDFVSNTESFPWMPVSISKYTFPA